MVASTIVNILCTTKCNLAASAAQEMMSSPCLRAVLQAKFANLVRSTTTRLPVQTRKTISPNWTATAARQIKNIKTRMYSCRSHMNFSTFCFEKKKKNISLGKPCQHCAVMLTLSVHWKIVHTSEVCMAISIYSNNAPLQQDFKLMNK